ncbi:MAG: adenosylcobinamide-GDP ribazoletransferase [Rhodobacteraceae bacterium]|nr:adenosylcobinamide-GDP ribazoletransferase [Paracoccaceae bacterium]
MIERRKPLVPLFDLAAAFGLLTRLPLPRAVTGTGAGRGAATAWAYPLVGAAVGAIQAGALTVAVAAGLGAGPAAALALATGVLVTGALHEDGLADTADGLWGGWDAARRLEIMKDSRIGSYGVLALVLAALLIWSALTAIAASGAIWAPLIATGAASRAALLLPFHLLPLARPDGLAARTGRPDRATLIWGWAVATAIAIACLGVHGLTVLAAAGLSGLVVAQIARMKIGGQTGDILGATQKVAEIIVLLSLAATGTPD